MHEYRNNSRSIADVVHDLKEETKEFLQTRMEMLRREVQDKLHSWKLALPMIAVALALGWAAFLAITFAIIAGIAILFEGGPGGWALAALIVGVAYLLIAAAAAWFAVREIRDAGVTPRRTMRVLQQDQAWLSREAQQVRSA